MDDCLDQRNFGGEGSAEWTEEVFRRAYCAQDGPFDRVRKRLELGFSVLVYLPGSCMDAAAAYIQKRCRGRNDERITWTMYGEHPGQGKGMDALWDATTGIIQMLANWLNGGGRPDAIFKNLDRLFSDNNRGVIQTPGAQIALFSLIESTRHARTLGLANRDFGKLPDAVETAFSERLWLDEVAMSRFRGLIPAELAGKVGSSKQGGLPEAFVWMLGTRLRWTDPIRAVMIMRSIGEECREGDMNDALEKAWEASRPVEFTSPDDAFTDNPQRVKKGFPRKVLDPIETCIIKPYRLWKQIPATDNEACQRQLAKLPPGLIMYGPPGTGKTYLAKWIAKTIGLPIRVVSGADLRVPDFGETERNIVRLLRGARRAAPCVIVLDDADDLLVARSEVEGAVSGAERAIVNTMLQELSGFEGRLSGVLVIMTTNRFQHLDQAIQGRLPLHIAVTYPVSRENVESIVDSVANDYGFDVGQKKEDDLEEDLDEELPVDLEEGSPVDPKEERPMAGDDDIRARLVDRFLQPLVKVAGQKPPTTEEERRNARSNLFSPREIQHAMRLLEGNPALSLQPGGYRPTLEDVERMEQFFDDLANSPEMVEKITGKKNN